MKRITLCLATLGALTFVTSANAGHVTTDFDAAASSFAIAKSLAVKGAAAAPIQLAGDCYYGGYRSSYYGPSYRSSYYAPRHYSPSRYHHYGGRSYYGGHGYGRSHQGHGHSGHYGHGYHGGVRVGGPRASLYIGF